MVVKKGERFTDEETTDAAQNGVAASADECLQKFTTLVTEDGCCGG
jgi:hypothetical protein